MVRSYNMATAWLEDMSDHMCDSEGVDHAHWRLLVSWQNEGSSRSHSIFTVVVETSQKIEGQEHFKAGKVGHSARFEPLMAQT